MYVLVTYAENSFVFFSPELYYQRYTKKTFIKTKLAKGLSTVLKKACVHVVVINNWFPELCNITLPLIEKWALNINADFNLITTPKFEDYPANYERFQIFESGKGYEWNINIDADFIVHPELEDVTDNDPMIVRAEAIMKADHFFYPNVYFLRDGRNIGMSDNFILSSQYTHDVWTPLNMSYEEARQHCTLYERQVSEFAVSLNIARFGLKCSGCVKDKSKLYHIQSTGSGMNKEDIIDLAKMKMKEMGIY